MVHSTVTTGCKSHHGFTLVMFKHHMVKSNSHTIPILIVTSEFALI